MFHWPVRVYYEDTDSGGVVYYANYLKFMERARTEWLRSLGFEQDVLNAQHGIIFAVRSVTVEYLRPARFNDLLSVGVRLGERRAVGASRGCGRRRRASVYGGGTAGLPRQPEFPAASHPGIPDDGDRT